MTLTNAPAGSEILFLESLAGFLTIATIWFVLKFVGPDDFASPQNSLDSTLCNRSVCNADLFRGGHHDLHSDGCAIRSANVVLGAIIAEDSACNSYLYRRIGVGMVTLAQISKREYYREARQIAVGPNDHLIGLNYQATDKSVRINSARFFTTPMPNECRKKAMVLRLMV
jgi:hypothetical protein